MNSIIEIVLNLIVEFAWNDGERTSYSVGIDILHKDNESMILTMEAYIKILSYRFWQCHQNCKAMTMVDKVVEK